MRAVSSDYQLQSPATLAQALQLLQATPAPTPMAGGTDLMVLYEAGHLPAGSYVSLHQLHELRGIQVAADKIIIGALTTYRDIQDAKVLQDEYPNLVAAARETGGIAIQNRGTLGGNIINASPAGDSLPCLLAYGAQLELSSTKGSRWTAYQDFHTGYKTTARQPHELLTRITLPRLAKGVHYFRKVGTRKAQAISKVVVAAHWQKNSPHQFKCAIGSVAATPIRAFTLEQLIDQKGFHLSLQDAKDALLRDIHPRDDIRSTALFRQEVACQLLAEVLALGSS